MFENIIVYRVKTDIFEDFIQNQLSAVEQDVFNIIQQVFRNLFLFTLLFDDGKHIAMATMCGNPFFAFEIKGFDLCFDRTDTDSFQFTVTTATLIYHYYAGTARTITFFSYIHPAKLLLFLLAPPKKVAQNLQTKDCQLVESGKEIE
jgi:hypothetical protein